MAGDFFAHASAFVDEGAEIGSGTKIWHFCHVSGASTIGRNCSIGQNCYIAPRVRIGNNVKIQNNVSVYEGVVLEDDVFCGPSMVFTNVLTPRSAFPRNRSEDYAQTVVRRGASIGANATVICGNNIGEWALVGAGAVVTKDVPPHAVVIGNPGRVRGFACECGEVLPSEGEPLVCIACERSYFRVGDGIRIASQR